MAVLEIIDNQAFIGTPDYKREYLDALREGVKVFSAWANRSFPMGEKPVASMTLGSGLGPMVDEAELLGEPLSFEELGLPKATAKGHEGRFLAAKIAGAPVVLQQGRVHLYEGHTGAVAALSTRIQCNVGIRNIILTNAAGSLDPNIKEGSLVLITGCDSGNLGFAGNPSSGLEGEMIGEQFYAPQSGYSKVLKDAFLKARQELGMLNHVHCGEYVFRLGPNYEEPSDIWDLFQKRKLRLGEGKMDLAPACIGMSTVPEIYAVAQYNSGRKNWSEMVNCIAFSNITNLGSGLGGSIPTHEEVLRNAKEGGLKLISLCSHVLPKLRS